MKAANCALTMTWWRFSLILFLTFCGCGKQSPGSRALVVTPGQGIPKVVELGMSINDLQNAVSDLTIRGYPEKGFPWQQNAFGERPRMPWEKPVHVTAVSRSLGLVVGADSEDRPVQVLGFFCDPHPLMIDTNTWFTGRLSCGLSFANHRRVTRAEIVAVFGEPSIHRMELGREEWQLIQDGTGLSSKSSTGNGIENLFYPTNGISFCLKDDLVISFQIRQKITKSKPAHESP